MKTMKNSIIFMLIISMVFVVGCASTEPTIDQSMEEMMEFMNDKPDQLTSTQSVNDAEISDNGVKDGIFTNLNYMTSGSAEIQEKGGKFYLVLGKDFSTPAGPDLVLYMTKNSAPTTRDDIKVGMQIAELKSTTGMQVYELPVSSIGEYNSVTIHCRAFNVPWSWAKLE